MKVGDKVKVIKDNNENDPFDALVVYGVYIGSIGKIVEIGDELLGKENLIVKFGGEIFDSICLAPDEVEVIYE